MPFLCLSRLLKVPGLVRPGQRSLHVFTKFKSLACIVDNTTTVNTKKTLPSCTTVLISALTQSLRACRNYSVCTSPQNRNACYARQNPLNHAVNYPILTYDVCSGQRRHAGHSKWANIRHIKAAKDGQKATMTGRIVKNIRVAMREGGAADPKFNNQLARVIETAYKHDVPKTVVENALKNAIKASETSSVVTFDCKGPGSFMMIVETFTCSFKKMRMALHIVFKKFGGQINEKQMGGHFFDYKGVIQVSAGEALANYEAAEEAGILAEAEEVVESLDDDGKPVFQFICDPKAVHGVWKTLVEQNPDVSINSPIFQYLAKEDLMMQLAGPDLDMAVRLVEALEELEEVERVYTNIKAVENLVA